MHLFLKIRGWKVMLNDYRNMSLSKFKIPNFLSKQPNLKRLVIMLIIAFVTMSVLKPGIFLTQDYFSSMLGLFPEYGIISIAMMIAMISGGIDLAAVSIANFTGIITSLFLIRFIPADATNGYAVMILICGFFLSVIMGGLCGSISATLISKVGIPPILATLGTNDLILGAAIALTKGSSISSIPSILSDVGNYMIGGIIPVTLIAFIICGLMVSFILSKTTFGFKLYMMGSNQTASRFSGTDNTKIVFTTYILSGMLASISGLLMCARFNTARADFGTSYTMQAILVCVLSGVSPNGGFGNVAGITLSVLILQILSSGFNMFSFISNFYRDLIWGAVLLAVLLYNYISNKRQTKTMRKNTAVSKA